ncbi:MAG: hypothetical protein U0103_05950 [Candidatus Obscuribacterales bacterium]
MAGDKSEGVQTAPPAPESEGLFGRVMGHIKHGASVVHDAAGGVVKKGVEKTQEIAHSETTHRITGQIAEAGKDAFHKGKEIAQSPTTKKIAGEVAGAGHEVARDHVNKVQGIVAAEQRGDYGGMVRNALPLAAEVIAPHAAALAIVKDKGGKIVMDHVPTEHRDTAKKIKDATDLATTKPTLPNLILHGADQSAKR